MQADDENRIYVVCSKYVSEGALRSTFALHGEVNEVKLLRDGRGNSRGCAFVTFRDRAGAECAVQACNGTELRGRALKVGRHNTPPGSCAVVLAPPYSGASGDDGRPSPRHHKSNQPCAHLILSA